MTAAPRFRDVVRRQLRDAVLDEARRMAVELGWGRVRMGRVAEHVGISRQVLYSEFDSKDGLGQAVVAREAERFVAEVAELLDRLDDPAAAISAAVEHVLTEATTDPLIAAILAGMRGSDSGLLPLLTTRSGPIMASAGEVVARFLGAHYPGADREDLATTVDVIVRMTVSHMIFSADRPDRTGDRIARVALRNLGQAPSSACPRRPRRQLPPPGAEAAENRAR